MKIKPVDKRSENKYPTIKEYNLSLKLCITLILTPLMIVSCGEKSSSKKNGEANKDKVVKSVEKTESRVIKKGIPEGLIKVKKKEMIENSGMLGIIRSPRVHGNFFYNGIEEDDEDLRLPDED